jgi:hypothetical protein
LGWSYLTVEDLPLLLVADRSGRAGDMAVASPPITTVRWDEEGHQLRPHASSGGHRYWCGEQRGVSHAISSHSSSARLVAAVVIGRDLALPPPPRLWKGGRGRKWGISRAAAAASYSLLFVRPKMGRPCILRRRCSSLLSDSPSLSIRCDGSGGARPRFCPRTRPERGLVVGEVSFVDANMAVSGPFAWDRMTYLRFDLQSSGPGTSATRIRRPKLLYLAIWRLKSDGVRGLLDGWVIISLLDPLSLPPLSNQWI